MTFKYFKTYISCEISGTKKKTRRWWKPYISLKQQE